MSSAGAIAPSLRGRLTTPAAGVLIVLLAAVGPALGAPQAQGAPDSNPAAPAAPAAPTATSATPATTGSDDPDVQPPDQDRDAATEDPLEVTIDGLDPSTLPTSGEVRISGRITNRSDEDWTELAVYAATSASAITTDEQLRDAESGPAGVEPSDYQRLVEPGLFDLADDLGPGESTPYQLQVPRGRLGIPREAGVYRLGVQVLGTEPAGRIDGADGRARVLVASVPRSAPPTPVAVALQVRRLTVRTATGEVDREEAWQRTLSRTGRLHSLVGLMSSASRFPASMVLDPAVVEAAGSLAAGNPPLDLTTDAVAGVRELQAIEDAEPPAASGPAATPTPAPSPEVAQTAETAAAATAWLRRVSASSEAVDLQSLPYGDLDLGAAVRADDPDLIGRSLASGISLLAAFGMQASGVIAPYHGLLGESVAEETPQGVPSLVKTARRDGTDRGARAAQDLPHGRPGGTGAGRRVAGH